MTGTRKLALSTTLALTAAITAYAADQTILGSQLLVKNPSTAAKRKVVGKGKEVGSPNTIAGNPTVSGGVLVVTANGGTPSAQTYLLPQAVSGITGKSFWSGDAIKGFKYKDPKGENGPVKVAQIKKSASGTFAIKTVIVGKNGLILVTPPNPGTGGCVLLGLNGGDTYSIQFGPTSQITNKGTILFKAKKPTVEGTCITTTTIATTTTTSSSTSSTTSTTLYGSPSRAFIDRVTGLLD
jgi:hypothetical protein